MFLSSYEFTYTLKRLVFFAINSVAPLTLMTLHSSLRDAILSSLIISPLGISLYLYLRSSWPKTGLYDAIQGSRLGKVQLYSWVVSYFLYLSYTLDYAVFYDLNLHGVVAYSLLGLLTLLTGLVLLGRAEMLLIPLALGQLGLAFLYWTPSPAQAQHTIDFLDILNSSLLLVCMTLIPYADGEPKMAWVVPISLGVGVGSLIAGSFLVTPLSQIYGSISMIGLVMVEGLALNRVFRSQKVNPMFLLTGFLVSVLISLISPLTYYNLTIAPSVALLYLSLFLAFAYLLTGVGRIFSWASAGLMMYGLYNSFLVGDLIQQVSILLAIFVIVLVGLTLKRKGASTP
ncbi:hypothetical protein HA72_0346 [Metallosphaera sedula]|uniref:Uncharacterized protein n=2 Tax=Metallosphaera sedula TaxID=43687 RepID=A4YDM1_METS5|nr:hypothetical protein Msed_0346 [Metallosphaera sedula DSM 5348]AIM26510.1 hypothetical protein HA72_0346 [Metallosphaera sedula]